MVQKVSYNYPCFILSNADMSYSLVDRTFDFWFRLTISLLLTASFFTPIIVNIWSSDLSLLAFLGSHVLPQPLCIFPSSSYEMLLGYSRSFFWNCKSTTVYTYTVSCCPAPLDMLATDGSIPRHAFLAKLGQNAQQSRGTSKNLFRSLLTTTCSSAKRGTIIES